MKSKFKLNLSRGLALIALLLASSNGFAMTNATATKSANPAASTVAPTSTIATPGVAKAAPATLSSAVTEDIRDIRGPKHIPSPWLWPLWLTVGAALTALLYAGWRWNRRRALAAALLPYEIALARLEEARALMQPENAREFSITVSEIVRNYIQERFHVWAARRTTEEFLYDLLEPSDGLHYIEDGSHVWAARRTTEEFLYVLPEPSDALLTSHRELLADFLSHCDLAKFARWILSIEEMETMLQSAHNFVFETGKAPTRETIAAAAPPIPETAPAAAEPVYAHS